MSTVATSTTETNRVPMEVPQAEGAQAPQAPGSPLRPVVDAILEAVRGRVTSRRLPEATYRLQFSHAFTFREARSIVDYLAALGISDAYGSPYVKARAGTSHGYDVVDHNALNPEIGGEDEYNAYADALKSHGMGQILDVVPNHMGIASGENAWWLDVLENGPGSPYASFFDIDWMPLKPDLANKVLVPILGDQYGKVLEDQQLVLVFEGGAFSVRYFDRSFPIAPHSWGMILKQRSEELRGRLGADNPQMLEYDSILTAISHLPPRTETDPEQISLRRREKEVLKRRLTDLATTTPEVSQFITENVALFNGCKGDAHSFDLLDELLLDQSYRLAYWRVAADEINYRRFFDVNELAAIRMENPEVFEKTHQLILRWLAEGKLTGLRIDHPDGLYDPQEYLRRLQRARFLQLCKEEFDASGTQSGIGSDDPAQPDAQPPDGELGAANNGSGTPDDGHNSEAVSWNAVEAELSGRFDELSRTQNGDPLIRPLYLVVEKILEPGERLPEDWPVYGTTGYDFLTTLNGLFVDHSQARSLTSLYSRLTGERTDVKELMYQCKKLIMQVSMSSEVNVLAHQLDRISERNRRSRDFTLSILTEALREVVACFPVYRTYVRIDELLERDRHYIERAVAWAKRKNPAISGSVFDFLRDILLLKHLDGLDDDNRAAQISFVGRFQQVTGPVMAKAVEDTAFYRYNRLVALNEVGGDPERFGTSLSAFHQQNLERQAHWSHSLLATSTHDTKRGEDVRMRIDVLSEIPKEFRQRIFRWVRLNHSKKTVVEEQPAPSRNDEYLIYQTLIGSWPLEPLDDSARARYLERVQQYLLKATHEAKVNTSWISPNEAYEKATLDFLAALLTPSRRNLFLPDCDEFARRIAAVGVWSSLSQVLLKLACPGVPDFYQGTELWDDSLVDPDNRRPVDYQRRIELLESLQQRVQQSPDNLSDLAEELVAQPLDGRLKLYLIWRMLGFRGANPGLCTTGRYMPLDVAGAKKDHLCAFARKTPDRALLVVAPRLIGGLTDASGQPPLGAGVWGDTELVLPLALRGSWRNVFTGEEIALPQAVEDAASTVRIPVANILRTFPVAALERVENPERRASPSL